MGKTVLELGAGAGLPSLICAMKGAKKVIVTDYPDADLIENLARNIDMCPFLPSADIVTASGLLWGSPVEDVMSSAGVAESGFDLLILADLLFNHSEHGKLVTTMQQTLKQSSEAMALVFFTPYRPWLLQKDLAFFDLVKAAGFVVEKIFKHVMEKVMFDDDPGVCRMPFLGRADAEV